MSCNVTLLVERGQAVRGFQALDALKQDIRYAARSLRKTPAFTAAAVLTLALGIGATTAIYAVAYAVWLKPLPYREPDRLVIVRDAYQGAGANIAMAELPDLRTLPSLESVAAYSYGADIVKIRDEPTRVLAFVTTSNLFAVLGANPAIGRTFAPADAEEAAAPVVVLSDHFWRDRMSADTHAVGKSLMLRGQLHTIIGVMARGFQFPQYLASDVWTVSHRHADPVSRRDRFFFSVARLRPGVTIERAQAEASVLGAQLEASYPETNRGWTVALSSFMEDAIGGIRGAFGLLLGTVTLLLCIACANIAGLLLARGTSREAELGLRAALGASRARLISLVFTESICIALLGGIAGFAFAYGGTRAMARLLPSSLQRLDAIVIDGRIVAFATAVSVVAGVLCALAPALRVSVAAPGKALRDIGRGVVRGGQRMQHALIVMEVALSLVLMVGSGLMLRSFMALMSRDRGFSPDPVLTLHLTAPSDRYQQRETRVRLFEEALAALRRIPGVEAAGAVTGYPSSSLGIYGFGPIVPLDNSERKGVNTVLRASTPGYFKAMGTGMIAGRDFTDQDRVGSPNVMIVNESLAKALWPNESAVGKQLILPKQMAYAAPNEAPIEIVGVVADMRMGKTASSDMFIPTYQSPAFWTDVVVLAQSDPGAIAPRVRDALRGVEPNFLIEQMVPMSAIVSGNFALQRTQSFLATAFAILAALLSAVGLYGLLSHFVGQRIREIGIRMALGADRGDVFRAIVLRGVTLTSLGVTLGTVGAAVAVRLLSSKVFGLANASVPVFLGAAGALLLAAFIACCIPARRATRVDPLTALR